MEDICPNLTKNINKMKQHNDEWKQFEHLLNKRIDWQEFWFCLLPNSLSQTFNYYYYFQQNPMCKLLFTAKLSLSTWWIRSTFSYEKLQRNARQCIFKYGINYIMWRIVILIKHSIILKKHFAFLLIFREYCFV